MVQRKTHPAHWRHQQGAFAMILAGTLVALVLMLVLVLDSGRLYMEKRSLQKVADMAALEAVSRKGSCHVAETADNYAPTLVQQAAARNNLFTSGGEISGVECVTLTTDGEGIRQVTAFDDESPIIRVTVAKTTPASLVVRAGCLFNLCANDSVTLQASAIAGREEPIAAFSVGSRLLRFDDASTLGGLLNVVGVNLGNSALVSYNGLANVDITPDGLLNALGLPITADMTVGDLNALLATETVQVSNVLDAVVTLAGKNELLGANVELLQQLGVAAGVPDLDIEIPLLTQANGTPGLFAEIVAPLSQSANAALDVQLNALSVLETAIGIATHEHALSVDSLNISLLGLVNVTAEVGVLEPPSIVIGGIGATAYTAQVRTFIRVKSGGVLSALRSLLGLNVLHIDLPIALDLVTGQGVLEENTCTPFAAQQTGDLDRDHAEIVASGTVGGLCIGLPQNESQLFSKHASCDSYMHGTNYLDVLGLVKLDRTGGNPLALDLLDIPEEAVYLSLDGSELPADWSDMVGRTDFATVGSNSLNLGTLVEDLVNLLLNALVGASNVSNSTTASNKTIAENIWKGVAPATCTNTQCRKTKIKTIGDLADEAESVNLGLLGNLVSGLLDLVGGLLGALVDLVLGNGCSNAGLLGSTSDNGCINQIASEIPPSTGGNAATADNNLGLGILKSLLDLLGSQVISPLLTDLLGLNVSEVDVHLQDLNCGHAKLLR